jgi:outer membrane receptor protein involved in Fe transport
VNPEPDAFNLMTFNVNFNLQKWLTTKHPVRLNGYVYNVLDEDIYTPEYNRGKINSFPDRQGRGVYLGVQYDF